MKLSDMTSGQLFDLFVAHGTTTAEIAEMSGEDIQRHVGEMRKAEPDNDPITDAAIADAIHRYAIADAQAAEATGVFRDQPMLTYTSDTFEPLKHKEMNLLQTDLGQKLMGEPDRKEES